MRHSPIECRKAEPSDFLQRARAVPQRERELHCGDGPGTERRLVTGVYAASDTAKFAKWHRGMLEEGVYLAPSQFEAGFTGLKHTEADIDATIEAAKRVFARI